MSMVPDQFGSPEYHITIYYVENLQELIKSEENEKKQTSKNKKNSVKDAF